MFTSASPQNLVKPQFCNQNLSATSSCHHVPFTSGPCNCSGNHIDSTGRGRSGSFCICSSCGKAYENSGDSLSDFDLSIDPVGISGHKCPNSPSVRGLVSDIEGVGFEWAHPIRITSFTFSCTLSFLLSFEVIFMLQFI